MGLAGLLTSAWLLPAGSPATCCFLLVHLHGRFPHGCLFSLQNQNAITVACYLVACDIS